MSVQPYYVSAHALPPSMRSEVLLSKLQQLHPYTSFDKRKPSNTFKRKAAPLCLYIWKLVTLLRSKQLCFQLGTDCTASWQTRCHSSKFDLSICTIWWNCFKAFVLCYFDHNLTYLVCNVVFGLYNSKSAPLDVTRFQNLYDNIANQL